MRFRVLQCGRIIAPLPSRSIERVVKDYELDFFVKGHRNFYVDDTKFSVSEGDICFRTPGQRVYGEGDHNAYILTLDFSGETPIKNYSRNTPGPIQKIFDNELIKNIPPFFSPHNLEKYKYIFSLISQQIDFNSDACHALVAELIYRINADLKRSEFKKIASLDSPVDKAAQYIHSHFGEKITLETLANIACLDKSYFVRSFKAKYKETPINYLINVRLDNASELILSTSLSISEIWESCGYYNGSLFIAQYKKRFGMTPAKHRKQIWK